MPFGAIFQATRCCMVHAGFRALRTLVDRALKPILPLQPDAWLARDAQNVRGCADVQCRVTAIQLARLFDTPATGFKMLRNEKPHMAIP